MQRAVGGDDASRFDVVDRFGDELDAWLLEGLVVVPGKNRRLHIGLVVGCQLAAQFGIAHRETQIPAAHRRIMRRCQAWLDRCAAEQDLDVGLPEPIAEPVQGRASAAAPSW